MKASGAWTQKSQDGPPRGARIFLGIVFSFTLLMGLAAAQVLAQLGGEAVLAGLDRGFGHAPIMPCQPA